MSLWDDLPADARNSGQLDSLRPLLQGLNGTGPVEQTDADGTWSIYTATENLTGPLALDPRTGAFSGGSGGSSGTPIEFRDPNVSVALGLHLTGPGGTRDGGWRVILGAPSIAIRIPVLRGAFLDAQGQLRADPAQPTVAFVLPALRIRVQQLAGASVTREAPFGDRRRAAGRSDLRVHPHGAGLRSVRAGRDGRFRVPLGRARPLGDRRSVRRSGDSAGDA